MAKVVKVYDTREPKEGVEELEPAERVKDFDEIRSTLGALGDQVMKGKIRGLAHQVVAFDEHGKASAVRVEYEELPTREELHEG